MNFKKYPSIENSYRKKIIDYLITQGLTKGEFIVQEKAHGANLSFWYDGNELLSAKRSSFIVNEDFYNHEPVVEKYSEKVINLFKLLKEKGYDFQVLALYGELIGGIYKHDDVKKDTKATKIQKGIYYTPHNDFYAIDIALDYDFINIDIFYELMEETGFLYAKPIFRGTFDECVNYTNKFNSQISQWLGFPEVKDNVCEGIVIKSVEPKQFGDRKELIILKNKNEKWAEKAKAKKRFKKPQVKLSPQGLELFNKMEVFITENRLKNVLSKIGSVTLKEFGKIMGAFSQDVLEDFKKEHLEEFEDLEKKDKKLLTKELNNSCSNLIRPNFQNIVDGNFWNKSRSKWIKL